MNKLFTFLLLSSQLCAWQLIKEKKEITVHARKVAKSSFREFRGRITINQPLLKVFNYIQQAHSFNRWMFDCRNAKLIKRINKSERIIWFDAHTPWPLKDRDMYVRAVIKKNQDHIIIKFEGRPRYGPKKKKYIRMKKFSGYLRLQKVTAEKTTVIYQAHINPGGALPGWLVNSSVSAIPYHSLRRLRLQLKKF